MAKKPYLVKDGIERINGQRVPADRIVHLTDREALFDRAVGRLTPQPTKPVRRRRKRTDG